MPCCPIILKLWFCISIFFIWIIFFGAISAVSTEPKCYIKVAEESNLVPLGSRFISGQHCLCTHLEWQTTNQRISSVVADTTDACVGCISAPQRVIALNPPPRWLRWLSSAELCRKVHSQSEVWVWLCQVAFGTFFSGPSLQISNP